MISFFEDGNYAEGIDCSYTPETSTENDDGTVTIFPEKGRKDCVFVSPLDIPTGKTPKLYSVGEGEYNVEFEDTPKQVLEIPQTDKRTAIYQSILEAETLDSEVDLEGEEFTDFEIGEIITTRLFGGNPHAQTALLRKIARIQNLLIAGEELTEEMQATLDFANEIDTEIDSIINFFYT